MSYHDKYNLPELNCLLWKYDDFMSVCECVWECRYHSLSKLWVCSPISHAFFGFVWRKAQLLPSFTHTHKRYKMHTGASIISSLPFLTAGVPRNQSVEPNCKQSRRRNGQKNWRKSALSVGMFSLQTLCSACCATRVTVECKTTTTTNMNFFKWIVWARLSEHVKSTSEGDTASPSVHCSSARKRWISEITFVGVGCVSVCVWAIFCSTKHRAELCLFFFAKI